MSEFKILNSLEESRYFKNVIYENEDAEYQNCWKHFGNRTQKDFLNEAKKHSDPKKQAGYSRLRHCNYISLIIVGYSMGDGEFTGHNIKSTCLVDKNNIISDSNGNEDYGGEVAFTTTSVYHILPDGRALEYNLEKSYQKEIENIYHKITKIRSYYVLSDKLPQKPFSAKKNKI